MNLNMYEDYDIDNEDIMELPDIKAMHRELIDESIKEQIEDPFESRANFVEDFFEMISDQMELCGENPEIATNLKTDEETFCREVITMISDKFGLDCDIEDMELEELKNLTLSMYDFFIIHFPKNIKKFFVKFINKNIDVIADALSGYSEKTDVVTTSLKTKLRDQKAVLILSNLRAAIDYIISLNLEILDILATFNPERYDIYVLSEAVENMVISSNNHQFFYPLTGEIKDDNFDNVYLSIEYSLLKKFKINPSKEDLVDD